MGQQRCRGGIRRQHAGFGPVWQCAAVCGRDGMKLPLKYGRYEALKRLLVFVGTIADEREQWSQLAGVPAAIEGHMLPLRRHLS